jgi:hypothetical protein
MTGSGVVGFSITPPPPIWDFATSKPRTQKRAEADTLAPSPPQPGRPKAEGLGRAADTKARARARIEARKKAEVKAFGK